MTVTTRKTSGLALAGALALAVGTLLGVSPLGGSAAEAHNYLVSSNPAAGSTVTEQPGQIVITTNDALLDLGGESGSNQLQVKGPGETFYGDGCTTVNGPALTMPAQLGQPGEYTVIWQVVSTDGHPISNEFTFTWAPDAAQTLGEGQTSAPVCGQASSPAPESSTDAATAAPAPDATDSAAPAPEPEMTTQTDAAAGEQSQAAGDILWIGGAVAVLLIAGLIVLLVLRRRTPAGVADDSSAATPRTDEPGERGNSGEPGKR
jgi:methionine-rich copper-binding protein CopC